MKYEDFLQTINKDVLPFYMINGGESYLTTNALKEIEKALNISYPDFNKVIIGDDSFKSAQDIVANCQVSPFCDERRLIVVYDYMGKKNENDRKVFLKYFERPNHTTCLVFFTTVKSEFFTTFESKANIIDCSNVSTGLIKSIILEKVKSEQLNITTDALNKLFEYSNYSITKIDVELDKLKSLKVSSNYQITEKDVENNVSKDIEYVVFDLTNAICLRQTDKVYTLVDTMLRNKEQPVSIISTISNHFRRLFYVARSEFDKKELSELLGIKEFAIVKYKEQAVNFSQKRLKEIFDMCIEVEYMAKNGKMEGKNGISFLISNICK